MSKWQPIETAPKNPAGQMHGPDVLVWEGEYRQIHTAYWGSHFYQGAIVDGWVCKLTGPFRREATRRGITHWMPLPAPPQKEKDR